MGDNEKDEYIEQLEQRIAFYHERFMEGRRMRRETKLYQIGTFETWIRLIDLGDIQGVKESLQEVVDFLRKEFSED